MTSNEKNKCKNGDEMARLRVNPILIVVLYLGLLISTIYNSNSHSLITKHNNSNT